MYLCHGFWFYSLSMICMALLVQFLKELPFLLFFWERYESDDLLFSYQSSVVCFLSSTCLFFSPKMLCYRLFYSLTKLFGLVEQASTRYNSFLFSSKLFYLRVEGTKLISYM